MEDIKSNKKDCMECSLVDSENCNPEICGSEKKLWIKMEELSSNEISEEVEKSLPEYFMDKRILDWINSKDNAPDIIINGFGVKSLESFPENCNPFNHDSYLMGTTIGKNLTVMYENHPDNSCKYLVLVNTKTGERIKILIEE